MPLQRSRSKSKSRDKKSSADDKKVVKKSSVKTASKDGKVSQISKQSVVVNVGDVATKKKRGRPRMKKPAPTAPPPPRFVEPPQSGLVQQAPQQIYRPPPFPSQNLVQPQPQRDALAPQLPTSVSLRQTLDQAQSESRVQAQNQARIEAQRRLQQQQKSRSVGDVEPSQRLKKQQEARLKKLVPTDAPSVEPPPKVPPPKVDPNPLSGGASAEPNPLSGGASAEPISDDIAQKRIRVLERIIQKVDMRLAEQFVGRSAVKPSLTGNHPLEKFERLPPYQLEVLDPLSKSSQEVPFAESYAQAQPVEKDPLSIVINETQTQMKDRKLKELIGEFRDNFRTEPNQAEIAEMSQVARDYAGYV